MGRFGVLAGWRGRWPLVLVAVLAMVSSMTVALPAQAVTRPALSLTAPAAAETSLAFTLSGYGYPVRAGRVVTVQRLSGRSWVTVGSPVQSSTGLYSLSTSVSKAGSYTYRAWERTSAAGAPAAVSASRVVTVRAPYILLTPSTAVTAETVRVTGLLPGVASRPVWVQRLAGRTWVTVARATSSRTGGYATSFAAPATGSYYLRSLAPKVTVARVARAQYVTAAKTLKVVAQTATLSMPATLVEAGTASATVTSLPVRAGRIVSLQRAGSSWVTVATGAQSGAGTVAFTITAGTPGSYSYRAYSAAVAGAAAFAGATRSLTVIPAPVLTPAATPASRSIALSWTNPTSASLTGVVIRRATGATPPSSATAGAPVSDVSAPGTSFTDTALSPATQYSYALFAHSGASFALAATVTSTTLAILGSVTDVAATPGSTSIALTWTNPDAASLTGVMIRRAVGATPPATSSSGALVDDVGAPGMSFTDTGLATGLQYSYALFAHDGDPSGSAAATVTATTTPAGTGAVAGLVTEAGGTHDGLQGVNVQVHSASSPSQTYAVVSAADGGYSIAGLPPATDYEVCFSASFAVGGSADGTGYLDQCWHNQPISGQPTPVAATVLATTTGINAALASAGAISGTVTEAGGTQQPLAGVLVQVSSPATGAHASVSTAADGRYSIPGFPAGTAYQVCFQGSAGTGGSADDLGGYMDQCWQNQLTSGTATPVTVVVGAVTSGIDAALDGAGSVTDVTADPGTTSIDLAWTNPAGGSLSGVVIRRALGDTPPATVADGSPVTEVAKPGTSYTDTGLTSGARYSYSLFAHYGGSGHAAAATIGSTTLITASMVSNGFSHSCAVTTAGGVKCWGYNGSGELGNGITSATTSSIPVDVVGLGAGAGVVAVSAGGSHTCAVTSAGAVKCWGFNGSGELGDGSSTGSRVPVDVTGLGSGVTSVSAGGSHSCAVASGGEAVCWGYNGSGELGDGTLADSSVPVGVTGLGSGVTSVSAGGFHSCAVASGGAVRCWGFNGSGELGDGGTADSATPVLVTGLASGATGVSAGSSYTCAVTSDGGARCWGSNAFGQLGDGSTSDSHVPVDVTGLTTGVSAVSAGSWRHSCAVTTAGMSSCWGYNGSGQLGRGSSTDSSTPVAVIGLGSGTDQVSAGGSHSCGLTSLGAVRCWGLNDSGQLGDGTFANASAPVDVYGLR